MQKTLGFLLIFLSAWIALPSTSQALISISADAPVSYSMSHPAFGDVSTTGIIVGFSVPILPGFGYEKLNMTGKVHGIKFRNNITMYDLFYGLPVPVVNIRLGVGLGKGEMEDNLGTQYNPATYYQYYGSLGYPVFGILDLHLGYHVVAGHVTIAGGGDEDLDAKMVTLGAMLAF